MSGFNLTGAAAPGTAFSFGTPATQQNAAAAPANQTPAFGAISLGQSAPATGGFSFGAPAAVSSAPAPGSTSFSFGATAPSTGLAATAPAATSFGFGAAPATQPAAAPTFSFGNPTTNAPTGVGLAQPQATNTSATPALGTSFSFAAKPAATSASLNFGTTTTAATPFTGFNTTGKGLGTGNTGAFGTKPTFNNLNTSLPATSTATPAAAPFVGLGGLDVASSQPKSGESKQDNVKVKETLVPEEIAKTVEVLKAHIKNQKSLSSDIGRASTSKLSNVSSEIQSFQWSLQEIANTVETNYSQIKLLRKETSRVMQTAEMAQRTQDTPAGLQFENSAPFQLFQNLVQKYETDLINFRNQIALTEKHMRSLTTPQAVTPDDLKRGFKQINESFVSLAGRLNELHQKVEVHKEQFLNLRKYRLRDSSNVFSKLDSVEADMNTSKITSGPTPFSNMGGISALGKTMSSMGASTTGQTGKT
ncbi:nuclear pore complex protein Nup58 [Episyrphus balteatus]|uniref:nuclear pore complex protein Nup58 n=1 Tax=Episyrphus balteatus TaxID=286459 RepID=UPI00248569FE|nr:nuclear pore complex protein Nup58 [Episyrphus balteatus]